MLRNTNYDISSTSTHFNETLKGSLEDRFKTTQSQGIFTDCFFKDNTWKVYDEYAQHNVYIHFNLDVFSENKLKHLEVINFLKSWTILLVEEEYDFNYIQDKIRIIKESFVLSKGFDLNWLQEFEKGHYLNGFIKSTLQRRSACLLEFFDYSSDIVIPEEYMELIVKHYQINSAGKIRKLPASHDVLKFSLIVENYFKDYIHTDNYWTYYPIYLWWNLTNIIPLRINEFCNLKFDCLSLHKDGTLLELPRSKNFKERSIRYEKILISEKLAQNIISYQQKGKLFGESKTLLSYKLTNKNSHRNLNTNSFNYGNFDILLKSFYKEIVSELYGFDIIEDKTMPHVKSDFSLERRIRPNDTRHFAFLNLMLQGYHPSEIARLGGHKTVHAQMSYHNHLEYWIDSDLLSLLLIQKENLKDLSNHFFSDKSLRNKISSPILANEEVRIPLRIGYCTDRLQNCPVNEHYLCKHWKLTFEDYQQHYDEIQEMLAKQKTDLKMMINKLLDLHKTGLMNYKNDLFDESNSSFNYKLVESSKSVKNALYQLAKLKERLNIDGTI